MKFIEIIKPGSKIDFIGKRKMFFSMSIGIVILCGIILATKGLNFDIDFSGGLRVQAQFTKEISALELRQGLSDPQFKNFI